MGTYLAHRPGTELRDPFAGVFPNLPRGAACADADPEDWFRDKGGDYTQDVFDMCEACPITIACLEWALDNEEKWGVWGGTTPDERHLLLRGKTPKRFRKTPRPRPSGECVECHRHGKVPYKGRCDACYMRSYRARRAA